MAAKKSRAARPLTVSELAARVDGTLKRGMGEAVRVVGEISGFRDRTHWYFDLKDAGAVVSCVVFASSARRLKIRPADGQEVVARGRVEFWAKGGKLSLLCDTLEPVGEGALDLAFRQLCDELRGLGWFDEGVRRPIPAFPRRIAVITSETGAALQDVLNTARKRCPGVEIDIVDVHVQGESAPAEIARAVNLLSDRKDDLAIDAIILTRGGGSKEDLWAFNEREVARAIHGCSIPIVAAIGHETDTTIAELVADLRCATPTQAAVAVIPDRAALARQLDSQHRRMASDARRRLDIARRRIEVAQGRPWMSDPRRLLDPISARLEERLKTLRREVELRLRSARSDLDRLAVRLDAHRPAVVQARLQARVEARTRALHGAMARRLGDGRWRVDSGGRELEAISPHRVLDRGYSWTTTSDGRLVKSADRVSPGEVIRTRVSEGEITSTVMPDNERGEAPPARAPKRTSPPKPPTRRQESDDDGADQMDLF